MNRRALAVLAVVILAALAATVWYAREVRRAAESSGDEQSARRPVTAPPALAPAGAADHLPDKVTATPGATGAIEAEVVDLKGKGLAGVRVQLSTRADGQVGLRPVEARTGFDGHARFDGVEPGQAVLLAAQDGVSMGVSRSAQVLAGRAARVTLTLPESGVLEGLVAGAPESTAVVVVPVRSGPGSGQVARAALDRGGAWRMVLPSGEYRAFAAPASAARVDLRVAPSFTAVVAGRTTRLDLKPVSLTPETGTAVMVLEPGGAPSPGATVAVSRAGDDKVASMVHL